MRKIIAFAITFILVISIVGCSKNDNKGSITFYGEATKESTEPASKESFALTEEQAVKLQNIIGNHCDEWNDNVITDRLAYYFDGYFELGSENPKYYFTYEHNGIYQDKAFVELTTDEMQYIKDLQNTLSAAKNPDRGRPISAYIGDYVTTIQITHYIGGQETKWTANGDAVAALREWANALRYEIAEFEEGSTPGDSDGGEVWDFVLTEGDYPGFSYIINGTEECYLLIESYWYVVTNPSNPPVSEQE